MILYLNEFETFPAQTLLKMSADKFQVGFNSIKGVDEVEQQLNIQKSGEEYYCQGEVRAVVELECSRCLSRYKKNLTSKTDFIVCSKEKYEQEKDIIDNEDYAFYSDNNESVDLSGVVRQALILAVSLKPLCSEDCLGLCPNCGVNLNKKSCSCKKEQYDTRWESLKKLSTLAKKEGK